MKMLNRREVLKLSAATIPAILLGNVAREKCFTSTKLSMPISAAVAGGGLNFSTCHSVKDITNCCETNKCFELCLEEALSNHKCATTKAATMVFLMTISKDALLEIHLNLSWKEYLNVIKEQTIFGWEKINGIWHQIEDHNECITVMNRNSKYI